MYYICICTVSEKVNKQYWLERKYLWLWSKLPPLSLYSVVVIYLPPVRICHVKRLFSIFKIFPKERKVAFVTSGDLIAPNGFLCHGMRTHARHHIRILQRALLGPFKLIIHFTTKILRFVSVIDHESFLPRVVLVYAWYIHICGN